MLGIPNKRENLRGVREDVLWIARDEISLSPERFPVTQFRLQPK